MLAHIAAAAMVLLTATGPALLAGTARKQAAPPAAAAPAASAAGLVGLSRDEAVRLLGAPQSEMHKGDRDILLFAGGVRVEIAGGRVVSARGADEAVMVAGDGTRYKAGGDGRVQPAPMVEEVKVPVPEAGAEPAADAPVETVAEKLPPIREFDVETLCRLGREIYMHDQLAWVATDVLLEKVDAARLEKEGCCGWVVDTSGNEPLVRFVRKAGKGIEAAYDISFPPNAKPVLSTPGNRTLTPRQVARHSACTAAVQGIVDGRHPLCQVRGNYNQVVLDDPAGEGFLVYLLRPKDSGDSIPVGGHYRISVAADGRTVTQIDRLSVSCMTAKKESKGMVALTVSHLVSATPVETHVFLSLQDNLPIYVVTMDNGQIWCVDGPAITRISSDAGAQAVPAPAGDAAGPDAR